MRRVARFVVGLATVFLFACLLIVGNDTFYYHLDKRVVREEAVRSRHRGNSSEHKTKKERERARAPMVWRIERKKERKRRKREGKTRRRDAWMRRCRCGHLGTTRLCSGRFRERAFARRGATTGNVVHAIARTEINRDGLLRCASVYRTRAHR